MEVLISLFSDVSLAFNYEPEASYSNIFSFQWLNKPFSFRNFVLKLIPEVKPTNKRSDSVLNLYVVLVVEVQNIFMCNNQSMYFKWQGNIE